MNKTIYIISTVVMWLAVLGLVAIDKIAWEIALGSLGIISGLMYGMYKDYSIELMLKNKNIHINTIEQDNKFLQDYIETANAVNKMLLEKLQINDKQEQKLEETKSNKKPRKQSRKSK